MPLKAVFFDIDGTLVDSNDFHVMAWQEAFHDHGYAIRREHIRVQIGKGADQLIPALLPHADDATEEAIGHRHGEIFQTRYLKEVRPFPCAAALIDLLSTKGKRVLLASSAGKAEVDHYVELLEVGHALTGMVSKDDVQKSKPAGDIFAAALASVFPLPPSETFAIGDTPYDVESALKSDIRTIALRSGGVSEETLADAGALYVFASVRELFERYDSSPLA